MLYIKRDGEKIETCGPGEYNFRAYSKEEEEYVKIISVSEYNGYLNALRIINERMLKQIDKKKKNECDNHGYKIISCERKTVENRSKKKCWYITKRTPVTIEIEINEALLLIEDQLRIYYNYVSSDDGEDVLKTYNDIKKDNIDLDERVLMKQGMDYKNMIEKMMSYEKISFGLFRIVKNYVEGVYDITYKATEII